MKNRCQWVILFMVISLIAACGSSSKEHKTAQQRFEVKKVATQKKLHFTGTIQPLSESSLSSSVQAVVESMNFQYGQWVKKGDVILTLNSSELQKQYNESLTEYLKAKDNFNVARTKFNGTQELWAAGLLSKNSYLSEKSSLDNARVSLMQSTRKLTEMLEKMDAETVPDIADLSELSFSEFDKVRKALTTRHNIIHVKAPSDGILLYPPKGGDEKTARLSVGQSVKADQVLGLIGNLQGVRVEIDVPEVDIDKIYTGMKASVHGIAFGKQEFHGKLVSVNAQASNGSGGGLPSFSAVVEIDKLTASQQAYVKIGMSAAIELTIENKDELLIPINAISQEKGQTVVELKQKDGQLVKKVVTTGSAEADKVVITSGLREGDVVVYG